MEQRIIDQFRAGRWEKGYDYQYFVPVTINHPWQWTDPQLGLLLEKAAISLGELNSFARLVPSIDLFIQLHVTKEAVVSSRIEGTQTHMDEALLREDEIIPERRNDWREVTNYSRAMRFAIEELTNLPLSSRLLRKTHEILLTDARGENKMPGHYRSSQNWIGGASLRDATFIPPAHHLVNDLMGDLENFLHNQHIHVPALIRIGIAHYQFETIHPFLDGNGRIGRLLITLFLVSEKILQQPLLYLSGFFEKNRALYYDNLMRVRTNDDQLKWLKYFLIGVDETARKSSDTLSKILRVKAEKESLLQQSAGRRISPSLLLLNHLFVNPVIRVKQVEEVCRLSTKAANDLVSFFEEQKLLKEISGQSRYRIFVFQEYVDLFE